MTTIFQVLGAVLVLFFIFLTYMSAKSWRWVHVTFLFLVFVASVTFCVYAAMTLKTRATWVKLHDSLEKQLATTEDDLERTTRGEAKDFEGKTESLYSVREELGRTILDRGRVWRGCVPNINPQGQIFVQTAPQAAQADPNNPNPVVGPPKKHNIQPKTIVHAFREAQKSPESPIVPAAYIGEFRATPVNDQVVSLETTMPLSFTPEQFAAGRAAGTWALYESMPVDGQEWFGETPEERTAPFVDVAGIERLNPQQVSQLAAPYIRDGQEAADTDPPENVWYEVTFLQEFEVDVDAAIVNSIDAEPFNTDGQSVLPRLRRGGETPEVTGKVKFGPGEGQIHTAVLDQPTAEALIAQGICKLEKKIYRRKLNDYERRFRSINDRVVELTGRLRQVETDKKAMEAATAKADQQYALVEELKGKVNEDLTKVKYEVAEMEKYTAALSGRLTAVQSELSQLYRANKAMGRELAELTARLTEEIDRRSRATTAVGP